MSEPMGIPLSIGEARMIAEKGRRSSPVDPEYWSWVIEQLCDMFEGKGRPQGSPLTPQRLAEIRHADARFGDIDSSDHSVILHRRELLAALDHALARADELECLLARFAQDSDAYRMGERACMAKALAVVRKVRDGRYQTDYPNAHRLLDKIMRDTEDACGPAELPPHERTLSEHRRMREALVEIKNLGTGPNQLATNQLSRAKEIARKALE